MIPDTVEFIGIYAFSNCYGIQGTITIPDTVSKIDIYGFNNCVGFDHFQMIKISRK